MKIFKYLGIAFACIVLVIGVLIAYVAVTFDSARIKQEAAQAVFAKTGRTLTIDGDIALSVWPSLGVKIEKAALSEHGSKDRFAAFDSAHVALRLIPLLSKKIIAEKIELDGLNVILIRDRDGHLNIDDLLGGKKEDGAAAPAPTFDIAGLSISHAQLEWRDLGKGSNLKITDLDLSTGRATGDERGLHLESLKLATHGKTDADNVDIALEVPELARKGEQISVAKVNLSAELKGAARRGNVKLAVTDIGGTLQAFKVGGVALDIDEQLGDKSLKGNLKSPLVLDLKDSKIELPDLSGALALDMPSLPTHPLKLPLKGRIKSDYGRSTVAGNLATQFDETHLDARFNVAASSSANSSAKPAANAASLSPPAIAVEIDIDKLNADKYLPPAKAKPKNDNDDRIDLSALKSLNLNGNLHIGELQVKNVKARNLRLSFVAANGKVDIAPHSAQLYGGSINGALSVNAANNRVAAKESLNGINVQPLLKDLIDKDLIEGRGDVSLDIATQGATVTAMKKALSGSARAVLRDGAIKGSQLDYLLKAAIVGTAAGQGGREVDAPKGVTVPVRVSGPFEQPAFRLELANLVSDTAKARLEEKKQEARQKVETKVQDTLKNKLNDLLGK